MNLFLCLLLRLPFKLLFSLLNNLDKDKYIIQTHTRPTFCIKISIINYYKIMKFKKDLGYFFALLAVAWPAFELFRNSYTPTQVILGAIFAYIGVRLTYFVYFKNN